MGCVDDMSNRVRRNTGRKKNVLFICTNNSARSQMAEALLKYLYGDRYDVYSAGTSPTSVNEYAVRVMAEMGIDISKNRSKGVDEFREMEFDYVVTVCDDARESCPFFPGKQQIHRSFHDPTLAKGGEMEILNAFRKVRDEIKSWIVEKFGD